MNNYCWFCGNKINADDKKCSVCDADIFTDRVNVEEKRKEFAEIKKKEKGSLNISYPEIYVINK